MNETEERILAAVASGASIEYLIGKWSTADVSDVLRRNHLAADVQGHICPATGAANVVLSVLRFHPVLQVRRQAERATVVNDRLCEVWRDWQDFHADAAKTAAARDGMNALIGELEALQQKALAFTRGLKTPAEPGEEKAA